MSRVILTIIVLFSTIAKADCTKPDLGHKELYFNEFGWGQNMGQMGELFEKIYNSPNRLKDRFYFDGEKYVAKFTFKDEGRLLTVPESFINSITAQIEQALKRKYVDYVFFPDMGHSHFFVPEDIYYTKIDPIASDEQHKIYEEFLKMKELKVLYHTAEQLEVLDENKELINDRHLQWRFFTRNIVGQNNQSGTLDLIHNEEHKANTASEYEPGYRYWGAGFYIS